ncbi:MAG: cation-transporting P-type ATPase [Clostridia bacterium]|nr:cation-transporting P-type ATPase [Clostridia bacterium]
MNERNAKWHQMTAEAVVGQLHTNAACGLSRKAARSRFKKQGANTLFDTKKRSDTLKTHSPLRDSSFLLMLGAILLSAFFLSPSSFFSIVIVLLICTSAVAFLLQRVYRNENHISKYRIPMVNVVREGKMIRISARRVVRGDLLILRKGDIVPCDCRLLSALNLRVLTLMPDDNGHPMYRLLAKKADTLYPYATGEVSPNFENMIYGASEILDGEARAIAVETGAFTFIGAMESMNIPDEVGRSAHVKDILSDLKPFLRLYGFLMLVLLIVLTVVGMLLSPKSIGTIDIFLPLCILCGASSPSILMLYFRLVESYGRVDCMHQFPTENCAVIKSANASDRLSGITDLVIVGHRASSDGVSHFHAAMIGRGVLHPDSAAAQPLLQPLGEAFWLLHDSLNRLLSEEFQYAYPDSVFLSELISVSAYDEEAMRIRLLRTAFHKENEQDGYSVDVQMKDREFRLLFTENMRRTDRCVVYEDGGKMCAISPQLRSELATFCKDMHAESARTVAVIRQSRDGTLSLIGIVAQREQMQAVLPSVAEELTQCGVRLYFFLKANESPYASAAKLSGERVVASDADFRIRGRMLEHCRIFIGYPEEEILCTMQSMSAQGRRVAVLIGNAEDRSLLRGAPLVISCDPTSYHREEMEEQVADAFEEDGKENSKRCSQVIRRHADILIHRAGRFSGGLSAILQTLSNCRTVRLRMRLLLDVLFSTQLTRLLLCMLSLILGLGVQNGFQMIYSGFFVEIISLIWILSMQIPQNRLRRRLRFDEYVIKRMILKKDNWLPLTVSTCGTVLYAAILTWCGVIGVETASAYLFVSLILSQLTVVYLTVYRIGGITFRISSYIPALAILLPIGVLIPLSFLVPTIGLGHWSLPTLLSLPVMPILYLFIRFLFSFLKRTAK